ncbi:unnamed protein product [Arabidopsis halleri]
MGCGGGISLPGMFRVATDKTRPPLTDDLAVVEDSLAQYGDLVYPDSSSENEAASSCNAWCKKTLKQIKEASPLSLKITLQSIREGRFQTLDQCLAREYRISICGVSKTVSGDFLLGHWSTISEHCFIALEKQHVQNVLAMLVNPTVIGTLKGDEAVFTDGAPMPCQIESDILKEVVEYCEKHTQPHADFKALGEAFKTKIQTFEKLFKLINASNFFGIEVVLELTIQKAVEMMKDLTVDEVRKVFELTTEFSAEEEADLRQRFGWAFQ